GMHCFARLGPRRTLNSQTGSNSPLVHASPTRASKEKEMKPALSGGLVGRRFPDGPTRDRHGDPSGTMARRLFLSAAIRPTRRMPAISSVGQIQYVILSRISTM